MRHSRLIALAIMAATTACAPAGGGGGKMDSATMANDMAAITKVRHDYVAAWKSGNPATIAALYASDAHSMQNNAPTATGGQGIEAANTAFFAQMTPTDLMLMNEKTEISGDMAYDRGGYHL